MIVNDHPPWTWVTPKMDVEKWIKWKQNLSRPFILSWKMPIWSWKIKLMIMRNEVEISFVEHQSRGISTISHAGSWIAWFDLRQSHQDNRSRAEALNLNIIGTFVFEQLLRKSSSYNNLLFKTIFSTQNHCVLSCKLAIFVRSIWLGCV